MRLFVIGTQARNRPTYSAAPAVAGNAPPDTRRGKDDGVGTASAPVGLFGEGTQVNRVATLEPKPVFVTTKDNGGGEGIDTLTIRNITTADAPIVQPLVFLSDPPDAKLAAAEGGHVVISDDLKLDSEVAGYDPGKQNGRVYRLGVERPDLAPAGSRTFELAPGDDLSSDDLEDTNADGIPDGDGTADENVTDAVAFIVGRGVREPALAYNASTNPYVGEVQDVAVYTTFVPAR